MGILDNIERGLEKAVNGAFAKTFRSGLQPVEIAAALKNEADTRAQVISRERILVPNVYKVSLSSDDYDRLHAESALLRGELTCILTDHARSQGYAFAGPLQLEIARVPGLSIGMVDVTSRQTDADVDWRPALEIGGVLHPITATRTVVGRSREADVVVDDPGVSKRHIAVLWKPGSGTATVRDLGSTNGTTLAGEKILEAELRPDTSLRIGRTTVTFRLVPSTALGSGA